MIRQAISCDICGTEKKQTNHWFVAYDQGGELRVGGWGSRNRLRPGSKHLCGQTCLHKLVDDFMAKALAVRVQAGTEEVDVSDAIEDVPVSKSMNTDASQSVHAIVTPAAIVPSRAESRATAELVAMPGRGSPGDISKGASEEPPSYASRNWRAEAWERERARELRAVERRTDVASRRRSRS